MINTDLAPIVLFVYNRVEHTKNTLLSLAENYLAKESTLYIFSDGPKNEETSSSVNEVRNLIGEMQSQHLFKKVIVVESEVNKGLAKSIIDGVSEVLERHEKVIVSEDDLVYSKDFLQFMNDALDFYKDQAGIGSITGYNPLKRLPVTSEVTDVFLVPRNCSLGWATWKKVWNQIDWSPTEQYKSFRKNFSARRKFNVTGLDRARRLDNQMQRDAKSWSIIFGFNLFLLDLLTVYSSKSKLIHMGWDGTGTHSGTLGEVDKFNSTVEEGGRPYRFGAAIENKAYVKAVRNIYGNSLILKLKEIYSVIRNNV